MHAKKHFWHLNTTRNDNRGIDTHFHETVLVSLHTVHNCVIQFGFANFHKPPIQEHSFNS